MSNTNSYVENLRQLTENVKDVLAVANAINQSVSGTDEYAVIDSSLKIISNANIQQRLARVEDTVAKFTQGKGLIETDDGTYRKIKVDTVSKPAATINDLPGISTFSINPNWFFESLQYPRCIVNIDLKGKIDDDSDRAYVDRIIIDTNQERMTDEIKSTILSSTYEYGDMIEFLDNNLIEYKEDRDEVKLPLTYEKYKGIFQIVGTSLIKNEVTGISENWYYLSTINYSTVNEDGIVKEAGNVLNVDDYLRFNNSLFRIKAINQTEKRIRLEYSVGYETIGLYDYLEFYNDPFSEKIIHVGIGIDEIDIVYVKGVNENYNLLSREWSNPIIFFTNDLVYESDSSKKFITYYRDNVADFGRMWIAQAKEGQLPAYGSLKPNTPILNADDLRVVQINTQLNVTIDNERYNQVTSEIASTKSNISAIRTTISANKDKLIKETNPDLRETIQNTINSNTDKMNNLTTQLSTLVEELNTMLIDAGAIGYSPKYHVRGFFPIPEAKYSVDNGTEKAGKQCIIGFDIMYRYLHTDETGAALNTFNYTDVVQGISMTGTFTDWNLAQSAILEKKYNELTDSYYWSEEKMDGTSFVINQIDIPIRNGEKVEIKVRSISEAGYPYNPLKSDWSNSIIISFPDNLTTDDSVTKILDTVKSDMTAVVLQETLSSAGVYSHMADMNSKYKHSSKNIEYVETISDSSTGTSSTNTMPLDEKIKGMMDTIRTIATTVGLVIDSSGNVSTEGTGTSAITTTPTLDYSFKDGSTLSEYTGRIEIKAPYLSTDERNAANNTLVSFMNTDLIPYIRTKLGMNREII